MHGMHITMNLWRRMAALLSVASLAALVACGGGGSSLTIDQQPVDQTAEVGASATFTVVASADNVDYQWQISTDAGSTFNDIAGAVGATYITPITGIGDNGEMFRVIVSNAIQAVTSTPATLTVTFPPPAGPASGASG